MFVDSPARHTTPTLPKRYSVDAAQARLKRYISSHSRKHDVWSLGDSPLCRISYAASSPNKGKGCGLSIFPPGKTGQIVCFQASDFPFGARETRITWMRKCIGAAASDQTCCPSLLLFGPCNRIHGFSLFTYLPVGVDICVAAKVLGGDAVGFVVSARAVPHPEGCLRCRGNERQLRQSAT